MSWLFRHNWAWSLAAFLLGAAITWLLLDRRTPAVTEEAAREEALVGAPSAAAAPAAPAAAAPATSVTPAARTKPARPEPTRPEPAPTKPQPEQAKTTPATPVEPTPPAPEPAVAADPEPETVASEPEPAIVASEPDPPATPRSEATSGEGEFSRLMDSGSSSAPTLFDDEVPVGRFGPGSADAVPHQGPPDGFTIKGNAQSMLFHTPDSPYYGRTKAEVWFRSEADAERSGFTKYIRKPRKSTQPGT
ncbi:hypothetical protein ACFTSF_24700 [Kribbella sp. NPDC056951]|uniref:sunset domain-containing protein n=1 Tax=Kribbella sp. NPDC056951 TaxID=3345978 RepID=UPI0036405E98